MPNHTKPHDYAHHTVRVRNGIHAGKEFLIIDWLDRWTAGAHRARKLPSFNATVAEHWQRLLDEGLDVRKPPEQIYQECLFGKLDHAYFIFHQDSLDLEHSRDASSERR